MGGVGGGNGAGGREGRSRVIEDGGEEGGEGTGIWYEEELGGGGWGGVSPSS